MLTPVKSIMISSYPEEIKAWDNVDAEKQMSLVNEMIHGARSLRADYRVGNHIKAKFYFRTDNAELQSSIDLMVLRYLQGLFVYLNRLMISVLLLRVIA